MSQDYIHRVTLFKIPKKEDQETLLEKYKVAQQKALKVIPSDTYFQHQGSAHQMQDGKPYIVAVEAGPTKDDARNQGYTVCAKSTFKSQEDFDFYDKTCTAHAEIRKFAASVHQGVMMVYFSSVVPSV